MDDIVKQVIDEMTDTLLLLAWADYSDQMGLTVPGGNYADNMPAPASWLLEEAHEKAEAIYAVVKRDWTQQAGYEIEPAYVANRLLSNHNALPGYRSQLMHWASDVIMSALGTGAFWEDSHDALTIANKSQDTIEVEVTCYTEGLWGWAGEGSETYENLTEEELNERDDK